MTPNLPDPDGRELKAASLSASPHVHALKTWPSVFKDVAMGGKNFEVRRDDRPFRVGDVLRLREYDSAGDAYTGREVCRWVTYILPGGEFGVEDGYCVMGLGEFDGR